MVLLKKINSFSWFFLVFVVISCQSILFINAQHNPLTDAPISDELILQEKEPCAIIVFGATGDLTARKLMPALYHLAHQGELTDNTVIVGYARSSQSDQAFRETIGKAIDKFSRSGPKDEAFWSQWQKQIFYQNGGFDDDEGYRNLKKLLGNLDRENGTQGNRIYYLSTPPSYFPIIIQKLYEQGLLSQESESWSRVIIEKPFGRDLNSAIELQSCLSSYLEEEQVYRMDHYLGKEGVQNLFALRFESGIFEPLWNNKHIDNIQITLSEDIGIGTRAQFWEETGSLRDVFQNHLLQILSLLTMEPPSEITPEDIHQEKIKVLDAIRHLSDRDLEKNVVRAQYGPGIVNGQPVVGYKQEAGVPSDSTSETFVAMRLFIDNPRWQGVPIYIRAGKRMAKQSTEIAVTFKNDRINASQSSNALFIRVQPNAGVFLKTLSKVPGLDKTIKPVIFGYNPEVYFRRSSPEAYEKLLLDCIVGDNSLYVDADEQMSAWSLLTPILEYWGTRSATPLPTYESGSWGPQEADLLLQEHGHHWHLLEP